MTVWHRPGTQSRLRLALYALTLLALFWIYAGADSGTSFVYTNF